MFEKLESCEILSLAFPHRLTPNAFCLALFIMEYHDGMIHEGSFYYEIDGSMLFMSIFNVSELDVKTAMEELKKNIVLPESNEPDKILWLFIDENIFRK